MLIHTINFGDLEVPQDKIIEFKEGLPGFPEIRQFTVLELEQLKPFQCLQSLNDPPLALFIVNPFLLDPNYQFRLSATEMEEVHAASTEDLAIYAVATIPDNPTESTVNMMAPIVINENQRCGKQVILHDSNYSVRYALCKPSGGKETGV